MNTTELLEKAVSAGASDIFVVAGRPVSMRIHGDIRMEDNTRLLRMTPGGLSNRSMSLPDIVTSAYWKTQATMISLLRFRVSHGSASAHSNKEAPCPS